MAEILPIRRKILSINQSLYIVSFLECRIPECIVFCILIASVFRYKSRYQDLVTMFDPEIFLVSPRRSILLSYIYNYTE